MKHLITLMMLLTFVNAVISQYCPFLGPDQLLPCGINSTTLTADLSQCGPGGGNPNQTTNYGVSNIPYITQSNTGPQVFLGDDAISQPLNIGFTFCFFGNTYTQFYIGSNGWIGFSGGQPPNFASVAIPSALNTVPKNCIMGPWQDWYAGFQGQGQIRYQTSGVAPCRKLTVSWISAPMYSCWSSLGTFHIVIYESTNVIENHIQSKPSCPFWASGTAVQGVHNLPGTIGIAVPGRNSTQWTAQNNSHRWTPSGPSVVPTLTWYQVGNPIAIGTGSTITVTPPAGGANYTCKFIYPVCNVGWSTCNAAAGGLGPDTVLVVPGPPVLPTPTLVLADPHCTAGCDGTITVVPIGGTGATTINWATLGSSLNVVGICAGTYPFTLIDAAGCTYNGIALLNDPLPLTAPQVLQIDPICQNYCDGSATANPIDGIAPWTWLWSNGQTTQTAVGLCAGSYTVIVSDIWGCTAANNITITDPPIVVVSSITASDTVCFESVYDSYSVINQPGYVYTWTSIGSIVSGQGTSNLGVDWSAIPAGFTIGAVQVTAYNQNGCASLSVDIDLTIFNVIPQITMEGPFCSNDDCVDLSATPADGTFYINGLSVTQFCPQINTADSIIYTYIQSNCMFTDTVNFIVNAQPNILSISPQNMFVELCDGDTSSITYVITTNIPGNVDWSFAGTQASGGLSQTFGLYEFGTFITTAVVTSAEGCVSPIESTTILVQECPNTLIYVPNTFTPDGNEFNNLWQPVFTSGFNPYDFHLTLYNRWGQLIFESFNSADSWDGSYNNAYVQSGVYTWIIQYDNIDIDNKTVIIGHVTLFR